MTSICQIPHVNASILRRCRDFRDLAEILETAEDQENHCEMLGSGETHELGCRVARYSVHFVF